jgi:hypothetical protein
MVTKSDVFNLAKSLVGEFVLPAILKSAAYGIVGGVLFFLAGLVVYNFGLALLLVNQHVVLRMIVAILLIVLYTVLGIFAGLILGGTSSIRGKLPAAEEGINTMLAPVTSSIVERIPVGQEGVDLEKFSVLVDTAINSVAAETEQQRSRLFSFASFVARLLVRRLLRVCRALFVVDFIRSLRERGETHVNVESVEWFAREKLVEFVINDIRLKLSTVSKLTFAGAGILLLIPILCVGLSLISL